MRKTSVFALAAAMVATPQLGGVAHAAQPAAAKKPGVTLHAATSEPEVGKVVNASGTTSGIKPGAAVAIQQQVGSKWTTLAKTKTDARGAFKVGLKFGSAGATRMRAVATNGKTSASSVSIGMTAYRWHLLTDSEADRHVGARSYPGVSLETAVDTFDDSWVTILDDGDLLSGDAWALYGKCKQMLSIASWETGSDGAEARMMIGASYADGSTKTLLTETVKKWSSKPVNVGIRGVRALSLTAMHLPTNGQWSKVGFASPLVLCAF